MSKLISNLPPNNSQHNDDELMHWKYLKREKIKGKWKYWYDYDSLKKDIKSTVNKVTNTTSKKIASGKKTLKKYINDPVKSTVSKMTNDTKKTIESVKKRVHKYIAKVPVDGDTYRYFYSTEAYQSYLKGKAAVDKILDKSINATPSDTAKTNAKKLTFKSLFGKFGKSVYNVVAPALVALQVEATTPKSFSELKKTKTKQTNDEHQLAVNPKFNKSKYDYSMNCSFCTAAYDLRKRGYDVEANPISQVEAYTVEDVCSWYKGAKSVSRMEVIDEYRSKSPDSGVASNRDMLTESLKSQGEGARGHLALYWTGGGGHDVIWEVENGEVVIRDCQTGEVSRTLEYLNYAYDYDYVRTDNLEPTEAVLRTVRNRK